MREQVYDQIKSGGDSYGSCNSAECTEDDKGDLVMYESCSKGECAETAQADYEEVFGVVDIA
jgi:hypothetical protein